MTDRVKVLYIAAAGRSGTTLLNCMLGQVDGLFAAGELTYLWDRGLAGDELCGCGRPFSRCRLWTRIMDRALDATARSEPERLVSLRDGVCRLSRLPLILFRSLQRRRFEMTKTRYMRLLASLYCAIRDVTGCEVIVDSSKHPSEAYLLREIREVELSVVHVVRNANAVVYAWQKHMQRTAVPDRPKAMPRYPTVQTAMAWNVFNSLIERLARDGAPYVRVRYEDLVEQPRSAIGAICRLIGRHRDNFGFVGNGQVNLAPNHTVSGNPARFRYGEVPLRLDREWERQMPRGQKALVNVLTYPVARRYGYLRAPREMRP